MPYGVTIDTHFKPAITILKELLLPFSVPLRLCGERFI
jgi:hypothetical protein